MKVSIYPNFSNDNEYLSIIINEVTRNGWDVEPFKLDPIRWLFGKYHIDVVHFNWFENVEASNLWRTLLRCGKRIVIIWILCIRHVKIITTIHNRLPHDAKYKTIDKFFSRFLYTKSNALTVLSKDTYRVLKEQFGNNTYKIIENKIFHIPHPNYIGAYPEKLFHSRQEDGRMRCVFIGAIKPYKNIELIIEVARRNQDKDIEFIIAGSGNAGYLEMVNRLAEGLDNIKIIPRFIKNDEIYDVIENSDIMIMPYDQKSSLNSGTCYLAFSFGRTVICPLIGTIKEVGTSNCYSYNYETKEEHLIEFEKAVLSAYSDYKIDPKIIIEKGAMLRQKVISENSPIRVGKQYVDLYNSMLSLEGRNICRRGCL